MLNSNDIDIFFDREELLDIFKELLIQIKNKNLNHKIRLNIVGDLSKKNLKLITILDDKSLIKLINKSFIFNNFIFVIGNINQISREYLENNFINYECLDPPVSCLNLIMRCDNLITEINNSRLELVNYKKFSYSFYLNTIYVNNSSLYLTDKENEIFQFLLQNLGETVSRKHLLSKVWSYGEEIDTHTLETHIYTLRKKIKKKLKLEYIIDHEEDGYRIKK